jgi:Zn-dependent metalloprotease
MAVASHRVRRAVLGSNRRSNPTATPPTVGAWPCCFIAPPNLLARLVESDSAERRDAALRTLAASASIRTQRSLVGQVMRDLDVNVAALKFIAPPAGERRTVYDVEHGGRDSLPGTRVRGEGDAPSDDVAVNEAYDGADNVYDFYKDVLGRDSIDGQGLELVSSVHYGVGFDNAFWNGAQMVYGDGSGHLFVEGGLTKAIDVIGHEMTHGVTQHTAGLRYGSQPGALNESMSDVFGALVKQYTLGQSAEDADWLIGEGTLVPELGKALRSMKEPGTAYDGDPQPAHMSDYVDLPDDNDPKNDNGGVHINSGIPNRAFYLAATALTGNAWERAGRIWYAALTEGLQADSDFNAAATATVEAAGQLFDSAAEEGVRKAWQEVGVLG